VEIIPVLTEKRLDESPETIWTLEGGGERNISSLGWKLNNVSSIVQNVA
jgi:hypothetical protein